MVSNEIAHKALEFDHSTVAPGLIQHKKLKIQKNKVLLSGDGVFYTLQGEGPTMGLPCVFVRFHRCNLECTWCDAWYTWNENTTEYWTESWFASFQEVAERLRATWPGSADARRRVIFSGGEPLIQRNQIDEIYKILIDQEDWAVEIETNGTRMPTPYQLRYAQFNVSPKLKNSGNKNHQMVRPKVLEALNKANSTFKFVCYNDTDLDEIVDTYAPFIDHSKIVIMPQGIQSDEIDNNMKNLYEPCMQRGFRLLGRMQAQFADGAKRGV